MISWEDFEKVQMRVGTVKEARAFPEARKSAYVVTVDFGRDIGIKRSSAQITDRYDLDDLIGRQVVAVVNFPPKQIGPMMSECLILGAYDTVGVVLLTPDKAVPNGSRIG